MKAPRRSSFLIAWLALATSHLACAQVLGVEVGESGGPGGAGGGVGHAGEAGTGAGNAGVGGAKPGAGNAGVGGAKAGAGNAGAGTGGAGQAGQGGGGAAAGGAGNAGAGTGGATAGAGSGGAAGAAGVAGMGGAGMGGGGAGGAGVGGAGMGGAGVGGAGVGGAGMGGAGVGGAGMGGAGAGGAGMGGAGAGGDAAGTGGGAGTAGGSGSAGDGGAGGSAGSAGDGGTGGTPMPTCTDGTKNGAETDVDCGGGTCPQCTSGKGCVGDGDCSTGACGVVTNKCTSPCADGKIGGAETDIDCGGGTCPACATGLACSVPSDCATNVCTANKCTSCLPAEDMSPLGATTMTLAQFVPQVEPNGYIQISPDMTKAYQVGHELGTRVYTRNVSSGLLTLAQTVTYTDGYASSILSSDGTLLTIIDYVGWTNIRRRDVMLDGAGLLPVSPPPIATPPNCGSGGVDLNERVGTFTYYPCRGQGLVLHSGVGQGPVVAPSGTATSKPHRVGEDLVWAEVNAASDPGIVRARMKCDGTLQPQQKLAWNGVAFSGVVGCSKTGRLYFADSRDSDLLFDGAVMVLDTNACPTDLATCPAPKKTVSKATVPSLSFFPGGIGISPDCSLLFVSGQKSRLPPLNTGPVFMTVLSLADPDNPTFVRAFEGGNTYDGEKFGSNLTSPSGWISGVGHGSGGSEIIVTREAVYQTHQWGTGVAVFKYAP